MANQDFDLLKSTQKMVNIIRRVDLSMSATEKLIRCEKYVEKDVSEEYNPKTCFAMMKHVCEKRNAAFHGTWKSKNDERT